MAALNGGSGHIKQRGRSDLDNVTRTILGDEAIPAQIAMAPSKPVFAFLLNPCAAATC
jgi:hypothetical protein